MPALNPLSQDLGHGRLALVLDGYPGWSGHMGPLPSVTELDFDDPRFDTDRDGPRPGRLIGSTR